MSTMRGLGESWKILELLEKESNLVVIERKRRKTAGTWSLSQSTILSETTFQLRSKKAVLSPDGRGHRSNGIVGLGRCRSGVCDRAREDEESSLVNREHGPDPR
jgi:hypothetical protein